MPTQGEKYHIVPFQNGWRVMADNGTFYSNKPLSKTRARQQQKALYAAQQRGALFHGKGYSMLTDDDGKTHTILEGDGFIGDFFGKIKQTLKQVGDAGRKVADRVRLASKGLRNDYPPSARQTIQQYGSGLIEGLQIWRTPIQQLINVALDYITKNKWSEVKRELNYDKLFHLALVATLAMPDGSTKYVLIEKNEVINIIPAPADRPKTERFTVEGVNGPTLKEFLDRAQEQGGADYFKYDAFNNNCQMFVNLLLRANEYNSTYTSAFVLQNVSDLIRKLPAYTNPVANLLTNIAGLANVVLYGEGSDPKKEIVMKPKDFFAEHKDIVSLLESTGNTLKKEAKSQAKEAAGWKKKLKGGMESGLALAPCEGQAHTGETTLTAEEVAELKYVVEDDDADRKTVLNVWKVIHPTLSDQLDKNVMTEVKTFLESGKTDRRSTQLALNLLATVLDRVFPRSPPPAAAAATGSTTGKGVKEMFARLNAPLEAKGAGKHSKLARRLGRLGATKAAEQATRREIQEQMNSIIPADVASYERAAPRLVSLVGNLNNLQAAKRHREAELEEAFEGRGKLSDTAYLRAIRAKAKKEGYDPKKVFLADNGVHKIKVIDEEGKAHYAGRVGYGDYILWSKTDKRKANMKRRVFHASHSKIKGDWKNDKYSPNMLALKILW